MAIGIASHLHLQPTDVEVGEHAVTGVACIVERELNECENKSVGIFHRQRFTLNWKGYSYDPAAKV